MNDPILDKTQVEDRVLFVALELFKHHYGTEREYEYIAYIEKAEEIVQIEMNYQFQPTQEN